MSNLVGIPRLNLELPSIVPRQALAPTIACEDCAAPRELTVVSRTSPKIPRTTAWLVLVVSLVMGT